MLFHPFDDLRRKEPAKVILPKIEMAIFANELVVAKREAVGTAMRQAGRHHLEINLARGRGVPGAPKIAEGQRRTLGGPAGKTVKINVQPRSQRLSGIGGLPIVCGAGG